MKIVVKEPFSGSYNKVSKSNLPMQNSYCDHRNFDNVKDEVNSVLRVGSAHNKGETADINIAQILHLSNFSDKTLVYIHL